MLASPQAYVTLLLAGLLMIGIETILPGGILGLLGGLTLMGAVVSGFMTFGPAWGMLSALGILVLAAMTMVVWVKYFPNTVIGRILTLSQDGQDFKATSPREDLVGQEGVVQSTLRPSGIARIGGRRHDVVTEGRWIEEGSTIKVTEVEGNRIVVREV